MRTLSTDQTFTFSEPVSYKSIIDTLIDRGETLITWNGSRFDLQLLSELADIHIPNENHVDGMLLAKMIFPDVHSYSLANMGLFFGCKVEKGEVDYDNAELGELSQYLCKDLELTQEVFTKIIKQPIVRRVVNHWLRALRIEQRVADIVYRQVERGVNLDIFKANAFVHEMTTRMGMIEDDFARLGERVPLPPSKLHKPPVNQFRKDGTPSSHIRNYAAKHRATIGQVSGGDWMLNFNGRNYSLPLTEPLVKDEPLLLSNQEGVKNLLINKFDWIPTFWNYKGKDKTSPRFSDKVTGDMCPDLERLAKTLPVAKDITDWLTLRSRRNVVHSPNGTGWVPYYNAHGKLVSDADTLGANTARFTHRIIANVPRVSSAYGKPMREMLCARSGKKWVGWDATALEAICEAHWTMPYDKDYANELINGDVHTKNLNAIPLLKDRAQAKTLKYALTYGAQAPRVQQILGCRLDDANRIFDDFWHGNKALFNLKQDLIRQYHATGGWVETIDGRMIKGRSEHSLINAVFQSTGAIIMKYAMVMADQYIISKFGEYKAIGLIKYHDEEIWECDPEIAEEVRKIGCASVSAAAKKLGLRVPLLAEGKIGHNWAEIH